eukprot:scaffold489_cov165-Alexandrium_tamarense.AAC.1
MGLPLGLLTTISEEVYTAMDSRIWVVENSNAMAKRDSHTMKVRDGLEIEMSVRIIETSSTPPLPSRICFSRFANPRPPSCISLHFNSAFNSTLRWQRVVGSQHDSGLSTTPGRI